MLNIMGKKIFTLQFYADFFFFCLSKPVRTCVNPIEQACVIVILAFSLFHQNHGTENTDKHKVILCFFYT